MLSMILSLLLLTGQSFADLSNNIKTKQVDYISGIATHNLQIDINPGSDNRFVHLFNNNDCVFIQEVGKTNQLTAVNSKYGFILTRAKGKPWSLVEITDKPSQKYSSTKNSFRVIERLPWDCYSCGVNLASLNETYNITNEEITDDGNLIKINLSVNPKNVASLHKLKSGTFWIDRATLRLERYSIDVISNDVPVSFYGTKTYKDKYELLSESLIVHLANISTSTNYKFSVPVISSEEATNASTLSAYGFPEPENTQSSYMNMVIVVVIIFLALFITRKKWATS